MTAAHDAAHATTRIAQCSAVHPARPDSRLVVVVGAGASYDAWDGHSAVLDTSLRPPLARELFDLSASRPHFVAVAKELPGVQAYFRELHRAATAGVEGLEAGLKRLAQSTNSIIARQYLDIPCYLQSILQRASDGYLALRGGSYVDLVRTLLQGDQVTHVTFLSLNYDTYLEDALGVIGYPIYSLDDYCRLDRPFLLAKLPGSVNWFCHTHQEKPGRQPTWREALHAWDRQVGTIEMRSGARDVWRITGSWLYPVLTAPMANKTSDDLVCPSAHLNTIRAALAQATRTLFIGVSGRDADLLSLLRNHLRQQDLVHLVGGTDLKAVNSAAGALIEGVRMNGDGSGFRAFQLGFSEYSRSRQLQDFVDGRIRQAEGRWPLQ